MKLNNIIFSLLFLSTSASSHAVERHHVSLPKAHMSVPFVVSAEDDEEEQEMTFGERAVANARDFSPFAVRPSVDPVAAVANPLADRMVSYASRFLGTRYRLGATGPQAFDCSGFTGWIYRHFGMNLERTSRSQFTQGESVAVDDLQPGDLLFFSSRSSGRHTVGHVAMVVSVDKAQGTCEFIHASTRRGVVYQSFPDNAYYSRHFLGARRMLGTEVSAHARL